MFCAAFLSKKTNLLDFNIKIGTQPSLSWFDQSLVISCLKYYVRSADIGCWERPADSRKVWKVFFFFSLYVYLLSIIIIFGVENVIFLFVCLFGFVWLFLFLFCFIYLFIFLLLVVLFFLFCFFCSLFVVVFMCCFVFVFEFLV